MQQRWNHANLDHGGAVSGQSLIVPAMATIIEPPRQCPLHRPALRDHLEALPLFVGRRLQVDCVRLLQASHPLFKPGGRIGTIDPYLAQPLDTISNLLGS